MGVSAHEVLQSLFNPEDTVCFRVFDDRKDGTFTGQKLAVECGKYKTIEKTLTQHNDLNRGIFFVVNYGGHEDSNITRINAQFVECDELPIEEQLAQINAFALPPSMIVKTRKSLHTYWFIKMPRLRNSEAFKSSSCSSFPVTPCVSMKVG
ncbi:MAG: hypothetical protein RR284_03580 [Ruthenibacterium sp.]